MMNHDEPKKKQGMHLSNQTFETLGESQDFTQRTAKSQRQKRRSWIIHLQDRGM